MVLGLADQAHPTAPALTQLGQHTARTALLASFLVGCARTPALPAPQLAPCWESPNCVSTRAPADDAEHHLDPLPQPEGLDLEGLAAVVSEQPGCVITERGADWLRAACTTPSGLYTDDLDVRLVDGAVHARSSSRVGYGDMGVNRKRVAALFEAITD